MFCAGMFGALKSGFRSLAALKLVMNVVGELEQPRHRAVSLRQHGFLVWYHVRFQRSVGKSAPYSLSPKLSLF